MQARTFLHNVRPGLLVIPVHAQLVLLGQIMLLLPTKVHAQPARHVLRVKKSLLLVQRWQTLHAQLVLLGQIIQVLPTKPNAHLSRHVVHR